MQFVSVKVSSVTVVRVSWSGGSSGRADWKRNSDCISV